MINLKKHINARIVSILKAKGYDTEDAFVSQSNRPDLSDYQSNAAMALAKEYKKSPVSIAEEISGEIAQIRGIADVSIDGPGFINLKLDDDLLQDDFEISPNIGTGRNVVIDYGGPNIAKEMHVGHLRSAIIGESIKKIMRAYGDNVIGDVHFGDWGTPIGMLIAQLKAEQPDCRCFKDGAIGSVAIMDIADISSLYRRAATSFKEDEAFKEQARMATSDLQGGHPGYLALWRMFKEVSVAAVKKNYDKLGVEFDLWLGESDVNDLLPEVLDDLQKKGLAVLSDGAVIVPLKPKNTKERAPLILKKSDGAYTYAATDLATMIKRSKDQNPDNILFVVDARQKEHFEQVFEVAKAAGYVKVQVSLEHIPFGTVNGKDGTPFKTREGGVMNLEDLIVLAINKAKENLPHPSAEHPQEELDRQAVQIAMGALKYQDLKNARASNYIFDTDNFTKSEGKTGAYIQYAVARINSILEKNAETEEGDIVISHPLERELLLLLKRQPEALEEAYNRREPSVISDYAHVVAQKFSSFYSELHISGEENQSIKASRLKMVRLTKEVLRFSLGLLGIETPERMLKGSA